MRVLLLICALFLTACTTAPKIIPTDNAQLAWERRKENVYKLLSWEAHLSVVGKTEKEKFKTRLIWKQNKDGFEIRLRDFIGRTVAVINGSPDFVELMVTSPPYNINVNYGYEWKSGEVKTSKGEQYQDVDAEKLIYQLFGLRIPVAGLQFWLRGVPRPQDRVQDIQLRADGLAQSIRQNDWLLAYQSYSDDTTIRMPADAEFSYQDVALLISVSRWNLSLTN